MFSTIYKEFRDINKQDPDFVIQRNQINFLRGKYLCLFTMFLETILFIISIIASRTSQTFHSPVYSILYAILIIFTFFYYLIFRKYIAEHPDFSYHIRYYRITLAYSYFFLLWGAIISLLDQGLYSNMNALVINLIVIAAFYYLRPLDSIIMYSINALFFFLLLPIFQPEKNILAGHFLNGVIIYCFIISTSVFSYLIFVRERKIQKELKNQLQLNHAMNQELQELTLHDSLTGLYNRRALEQFFEIQKMENTSVHLEVTVLDIDYFKQYNDYYGHLQGDQVLIQLGSLLQSYCKSVNTCAIRFGGEEFLILSAVKNTVLSSIGEKVLKATSDLQIPHSTSSISDVVTISAGVIDGNIHTIEELYDLVLKADKALYFAKNNGRNQVIYYADTM